MAFSVIQAGTTLQFVNTSGVVSSLTLPTGVSLRPDVSPRFAVYKNCAILVNTPSQPLTIDQTGKVRLLCPRPPRFAPVVSAVAGGALSGTYAGVRSTFVVRDSAGRIIAESDFSPASNSVALINQFLKAANIDTSPDEITSRRIYRPTNGASVLFQWLELDGNALTTAQDDTSDAGLSTFAAPVLGTPPDLVMIGQYKDRLFGIPRNDLDTLRHSEVGLIYSWPGDNAFPIPSVGEDDRGCTGLIARRDALCVGKQNRLLQFTGTQDSNFRLIGLAENVGLESQESADVYRDTAYFLWKDGVYQWNADGIVCLSDGSVSGRGNVRSWFATDDYFNRGRFQYAFGKVDPIRNKYRLFLATAGSDHENTWVEFDIRDRTWWGPHKTGAFVPTCSFVLQSAAGVKMPMIGSEAGQLYQEQETRTDGAATPIEFDIITKRHDFEEPTLEKYWGELAVVQEAQPAGTLDVITTVGELNKENAANEIVIDTLHMDMTLSEQRLGRVGLGKHAQLEFVNAEVDQDVELHGYEIDPVNFVGKR